MQIGRDQYLPYGGEVIPGSTSGQNVTPGDRVLGQVITSSRGGCRRAYHTVGAVRNDRNCRNEN